MIRRVWLAALLLVAGCVTPGPVPIPVDGERAAQLLARWSQGLESREALRGNARLSVNGKGDVRVRSKQRVVLARPARLRVEVLGLLGTTLAVLAVDDTDYAFFEAESRHFESGPVHPDLLWNAVRLDLDPDEVVGLLLGAPELPAGLRILSAHDLGGGRTRLTLGGSAGRVSRELDLDDRARLVRYAVLAEGGEPRWVADLEDYTDLAGTPLAHRVTVETRDGAHAVVSLSGVELNPPLSADIFRIDGVRPTAGSTGEGG